MNESNHELHNNNDEPKKKIKGSMNGRSNEWREEGKEEMNQSMEEWMIV